MPLIVFIANKPRFPFQLHLFQMPYCNRWIFSVSQVCQDGFGFLKSEASFQTRKRRFTKNADTLKIENRDAT